MKLFKILFIVCVGLLSSQQVFSMQQSIHAEGNLNDALQFPHSAEKALTDALAALDHINRIDIELFKSKSYGETPFVVLFRSKLKPEDKVKVGEKLLQKGTPKEELNEILPGQVREGNLELVRWLASKGAYNDEAKKVAEDQFEMAVEDGEHQKAATFKEIIKILESRK